MVLTVAMHGNTASVSNSSRKEAELPFAFFSTAWVTALATGVSDAFAMVPALLGNRLGFANVIVLGGFACAAGMFSSSFVPNIYLLYLTYGLVWGFGACLCYCSALFLLPQYFRTRLGLANGIVFLGAPVGTLVLSPVAQNLLSNMGLTGTFQVFAGLQLIVVFCGFVARLIPTPSELDRPLDLKTVKNGSFDWSIFKNKGFMVFAVSLCVFMPAYLVPYVHLVRLNFIEFRSPFTFLQDSQAFFCGLEFSRLT